MLYSDVHKFLTAVQNMPFRLWPHIGQDVWAWLAGGGGGSVLASAVCCGSAAERGAMHTPAELRFDFGGTHTNERRAGGEPFLFCPGADEVPLVLCSCCMQQLVKANARRSPKKLLSVHESRTAAAAGAHTPNLM